MKIFQKRIAISVAHGKAERIKVDPAIATNNRLNTWESLISLTIASIFVFPFHRNIINSRHMFTNKRVPRSWIIVQQGLLCEAFHERLDEKRKRQISWRTLRSKVNKRLGIVVSIGYLNYNNPKKCSLYCRCFRPSSKFYNNFLFFCLSFTFGCFANQSPIVWLQHSVCLKKCGC